MLTWLGRFMMHASDTACVGERRRLGVRIGRRLIVKGISQSRAWLLLPAKDLFNILGPVGHFACRFIRANDGNIAVLLRLRLFRSFVSWELLSTIAVLLPHEQHYRGRWT